MIVVPERKRVVALWSLPLSFMATYWSLGTLLRPVHIPTRTTESPILVTEELCHQRSNVNFPVVRSSVTMTTLMAPRLPLRRLCPGAALHR